MKSSSSSCSITALVLEYIRCGWKEGHMHDVPSYKKFNDNRGQFTLRGQGCYDKLGWTLQGAFDESVLLWHIVTDFCYHCTGPSHHGSRCTKGHAYGYRCPAWCEASGHHKTAVLCTHMSNYMAYLLFVKPDMLMAGTRRNIFTCAYKGLEGILGKAKKPMFKERELAQRIVIKLEGRGTQGPEGFGEAFVHDAWDIAKVLMALSDEEKMWKVIQGVWVEMLCFSAARCRGYLHAKSLGTGVEYLSYVWLLMYYMGMETLADRLQRVDHHDGGEPNRSEYS
ncbi:hypothetical protein ZWY2020_015300 [Hordeum vulgare]|nr:hypothetical protein ZWY2020_015300 [Hordeum vulgare]